MPALTIDSFNFRIIREDIDHEYEEIGGDRARMIDGSLRETVQGRKNAWPLTTANLTASDRDTALAKLTATPPLSASGDIFAPVSTPVNVFAKLLGVTRVPVRGGFRYRIRFILIQQ